jgi:hypothetical protein
MDRACHVIKRILNSRYSNAVAFYDVTNNIQQSLTLGTKGYKLFAKLPSDFGPFPADTVVTFNTFTAGPHSSTSQLNLSCFVILVHVFGST